MPCTSTTQHDQHGRKDAQKRWRPACWETGHQLASTRPCTWPNPAAAANPRQGKVGTARQGGEGRAVQQSGGASFSRTLHAILRRWLSSSTAGFWPWLPTNRSYVRFSESSVRALTVFPSMGSSWTGAGGRACPAAGCTAAMAQLPDYWGVLAVYLGPLLG